MSKHHQQRALDVALACKLTHVYGKYHLMMDYRQLAMSNYQMTYQQAERQAAMMNQITIVHHSPADFMETPEDRTNNSIDTYKSAQRNRPYCAYWLRTISPESRWLPFASTFTNWSHFATGSCDWSQFVTGSDLCSSTIFFFLAIVFTFLQSYEGQQNQESRQPA